MERHDRELPPKMKSFTQVSNTCTEEFIAGILGLPTPHVIIPPGKGVLDEEQVVEVKLLHKGTPEIKMEYIRKRLRACVLPEGKTA
jgi:hypothetical protein